jgi:hypothetical protein
MTKCGVFENSDSMKMLLALLKAKQKLSKPKGSCINCWHEKRLSPHIHICCKPIRFFEFLPTLAITFLNRQESQRPCRLPMNHLAEENLRVPTLWIKAGSHRQPLQGTSKSQVQFLPCTDILSTAEPRQFSPSFHHFAVNDFAKKPSQSARSA